MAGVSDVGWLWLVLLTSVVDVVVESDARLFALILCVKA